MVWVRIGRVPRFVVRSCLMVRRMDIVGARRGEIFFARTIAVLVQIGAGVTIWDVAMFDGLANGYRWHT